MKIINPILSGSVLASGSFVLPSGRANQRPSNPDSGSLFFEISDSGSVLTIYNGSGSNGWETVGKQTTPIPPTPPSIADIEYLVVAGGASGGSNGGGGGAGGLLSSSLASMTSGSQITVTVGAGGSNSVSYQATGNDGSDSSIVSAAGTSFTTVTAIGGGGGGSNDIPDGRSGGSGGGAGTTPSGGGKTGGSGTVGQGNDGGDTTYNGHPYAGAGGGGAGAVGQDTLNGAPYSAGDGGNGLQSSIAGTSTYYAGGGGGSAGTGVGYNDGPGTGGLGGGGDGGAVTGNGENATANTGGGGGASGDATTVGAGGSGVVILAYPTASISATGGVRTFFNDRVAHTFDSSGTFSVGGTKTYTHNTLDVFGDGSCKALYKFEGNANDESGNYNGTASSITYVQSYINNGAVFTGNTNALAGSKVTVSNSVYGTNKSIFSISGWVNYGTTSSELPIFGNGGTVGGTTGYAVYTYLGQIIITFRTDPNQNFYYSGEYLDDNEWHHIALTFDNGDYVLYIDNSASLSGTTTNYINNPTPTYDTHFGNRFSRNETGVLNGSMDQIRVFDKALSASEINTLYTE